MFVITPLDNNHLFCARIPENLEPHSAPLEIGHPEVGRYFCEFAHTHYVANDELRTRYPDDSDQTEETARHLYPHPRPPTPTPM